MPNHIEYMQRAYALALQGWGKTLPNPMVGAVVVKGGRVIGEGWHDFCGGPPAEAMALQKAASKAKGADLYITLEPCCHTGRTPPCTEAIIASGIKRAFVGVLDPNPLMNGKSIKLLRKSGISVEVGFLQEELTRLNEAFNKYISTGTPFVTAKIAQTLDGKIATLSGESKWITSAPAREYSRDLRFGFDAIAVGINTVLKDDPQLNAPGKRLKKIIFDSRLRIPLEARLFKGCKPQDILIFTACPQKKLNATLIHAPLKGGKIDLPWAMRYLGGHGIAHLLLEGGGELIGNALKSGVVDKMAVYISPQILGEGTASVRGLGVEVLGAAVRLNNVSMGRIGDDFLVEGYPILPKGRTRVYRNH